METILIALLIIGIKRKNVWSASVVIDKKIMRELILAQRDEITAAKVYKRAAEKSTDPQNRRVLDEIASMEMRHYATLKKYTNQDVGYSRRQYYFFLLILKIFGITFAIKLLERGERDAQLVYVDLSRELEELDTLMKEEEEHEKYLIDMINEERLKYVGSIVLGLNDALVELTGALAGFTFALQNAVLIALTGLITGVSAAMSMGASEYLSSKSEGDKDAKKSAIYTGTTYFITVLLLISSYFIFSSPIQSLLLTLTFTVIIIAVFNYYISVAKDLQFKSRFGEMAAISLGVALISFIMGFLIDHFLLSGVVP